MSTLSSANPKAGETKVLLKLENKRQKTLGVTWLLCGFQPFMLCRPIIKVPKLFGLVFLI